MGTIDLTLLRTFNAVYETRNLTRAAEVLCVTQPSVSYALSRLRRQLGDPLFVRSAGGVEPTVRADELHAVFGRAVAEIDAAVDSEFDPGTTDRTFRLCLSDLGELRFLPAVTEKLARQAPHAVLEIVPMQINDVPEWIRRGRLDAAVASVAMPGLASRTLIHSDRYVCVLPAGAGGSAKTMSIDEFKAARHVIIDQSAGHNQAEAALVAAGIDRNIALRLPHFSVLPQVLPYGDLVAIVPLRVARMFADDWGMEIREMPVTVQSFDVSLYWHSAPRIAEATQWFIDLVAEATVELDPLNRSENDS